MRLSNVAIALICFLVAVYVAKPDPAFLISAQFLLAFIALFLVMSGGNVCNDYFDMKVDKENNANRPIPLGLVTPIDAKRFWQALFCSGIFAALLTLHFPTFCIVLLATFIMFAYSAWLKKTGLLGNIAISFLCGLVFIYGYTPFQSSLNFNFPAPILWFFVLSFLMSLSREIIKGIADVKGDRKLGIKTLAVLHGNKSAAKVAMGVIVITVLLSPLPFLYGVLTYHYFAIVIVVDVIFIALGFSLLLETTTEKAKKVKDRMRYGFGLGILAFFAGL
jgi:geranylgeranylglycerol-phosphate geranylgeranyltransferase